MNRPDAALGDRFVLGRRIGSGGMSLVYLGRDRVLDRPVAVKVLRSEVEDPEVASRFRREGRMAARLSHPNIVQVYDAGEDEMQGREVSYIVMEYLSGGDLKDVMNEHGPLSGRRLAKVGAAVAAGLAHAHERGVIHRDVKPRNVLLDDYGHPKLADFGVARAMDAGHTTSGAYMGTALYSAPEQLRGEEATPEADVYCLGATLYHAATGEPPFVGAPIEIASQQMNRRPVPPRKRGADVGPGFEALVMDCLEREPVRRPGATDVQERLLQLLAAGLNPGPPPAPGRVAREKVEQVGRFVQGGRGAGKGPARTPDGPSRGTVVVPTRTFRSGARQRLILLGGIVVVVLLALVLIFAGLSGNSGPANGEEPPAADEQVRTPGGSGAVENGSEEPAEDAPSEDAPSEDAPSEDAPPEDAPPEQEPAADNASAEPVRDLGPAPTSAAAEAAVVDMYVTVSYYERMNEAWEYLSTRAQQEIGSLEEWRDRYEDTSDVQFSRGPEATGSSGGETRVEFVLRETRPEGVREISGTWVCVTEDGEVRLDRLENRRVS